MRRHGSPIALALLLLAIGAFWIHRVHVDRPSRHGFASSDMTRYFYPSAVVLHRELRRGALPLWNPYQMAGLPFMASLAQGPLYPPNAIALLALRPARALEVLAVAHLALAAGFGWAFARRIGLGQPASLAAGLAYALSGATKHALYNPAFQSTCAWLPALLWAVHGLTAEPRARRAIALGAIVALAFLGGYAQGLLYELQLAGVYGAARLIFGRSPRRVACLGWALAAAALALGLCAVQLLPSLELLREVPRAIEGLSTAEAAQVQPPPRAVFGGLIGGGAPRFATSLFALPLLAAGWFCARARRHWIFFAVAALVAGLFALGTRSFVFEIHRALPLGDIFRFPARVAFVYAFCWSVLIGIGVEGIGALAGRLGARAGAVAAALALALVAGGLHARSALPYALPVLTGETRGAPDALIRELTPRRDEGRVFIENFGRHYGHLLPSLLGQMNQLFAVPTYEPMIPRAYTLWFGQDLHWRGFVSTVPHRGPRRPFLRVTTPDELPAGELRRMLDAMSVRFYATHAALARERLPELEAFAGAPASAAGPARWIERDAALPRAYAVRDAVVEPDVGRAAERLRSADWDLHARAIVDAPVALDAPGSARDEVRITTYAPDRVAISARCDGACLVVLTDLHFAGWRASLDGQPAPIRLVNALFRGVRAPAGAHEIVYDYRPAAFRAGAALSAATLVGLALAAGVHAVRARRTG